MTDVDECAESPSLCANGHCQNTPGGFLCACDSGFMPHEQGTSCSGNYNTLSHINSPMYTNKLSQSRVHNRPYWTGTYIYLPFNFFSCSFFFNCFRFVLIYYLFCGHVRSEKMACLELCIFPCEPLPVFSSTFLALILIQTYQHSYEVCFWSWTTMWSSKYRHCSFSTPNTSCVCVSLAGFQGLQTR